MICLSERYFSPARCNRNNHARYFISVYVVYVFYNFTRKSQTDAFAVVSMRDGKHDVLKRVGTTVRSAAVYDDDADYDQDNYDILEHDIQLSARASCQS